jgi:hypothetical protein
MEVRPILIYNISLTSIVDPGGKELESEVLDLLG